MILLIFDSTSSSYDHLDSFLYTLKHNPCLKSEAKHVEDK